MSRAPEYVWLSTPAGTYLCVTPDMKLTQQTSPCAWKKVYNSDGSVSYKAPVLEDSRFDDAYLSEMTMNMPGFEKHRGLTLKSYKDSQEKWKDADTLSNDAFGKFIFEKTPGSQNYANIAITIKTIGYKNSNVEQAAKEPDRNVAGDAISVQKNEQMLLDEIRTVINSFTRNNVMDYPYEEAKQIRDSLRSLVERSKPLLARKVLIQSVAHGTYLYPRRDKVSHSNVPSFWVVTDNADGTVLLQPFGTDLHLSGSPERHVIVHKNSFDREKWTIDGNNIKSFKHGTYLSAAADGSVNLQTEKQGWEEIVLVPDANAGHIKYTYDKAAEALRQFEKRCKQIDEVSDIGITPLRRQQIMPEPLIKSEKPTSKEYMDEVVCIKTATGTFLYVRDDNTVAHRNEGFSWVVIRNLDGTVHFKAASTKNNDTMFLSAGEGKEARVTVKPTKLRHETWKIKGLFIQSYNKNFISADPNNGEVRLRENKLDWEKIFLDRCIEPTHIVENFDKFAIVRNDKNKTFVYFSGKLFDHMIPNTQHPRMLPNQTLGTCYFYAAMNMLINETVFIKAFLDHISAEIKRNKYSRKPGESVSDAQKRRFGSNIYMTVSWDGFVPSKDNMNKILDDAEGNKELFLWARHVIMYHIITSSISKVAQNKQEIKNYNEYKQGKSYDSQAAIILEDWSEMHRGSDKYKKAVQDVGGGGHPFHALHEIFRISGLEIEHSDWFEMKSKVGSVHIGEGGMIARIPGSNIALCVGGRDIRRSNSFKLADDGSHCGMFVQMFTGRGLLPGVHWLTGIGHALSYIRGNNNEPLILDSNSGVSSPQAVADRYKWVVGKTYAYGFYPVYTCEIPSSDVKALGVQKGGRDDEIDLIVSQSTLLVPNDASELTKCDSQTCVIDEDLADALQLVSLFLKDDDNPQLGGGNLSFCWAALSAVVMSMAILQG
jgi:hypothetical protein